MRAVFFCAFFQSTDIVATLNNGTRVAVDAPGRGNLAPGRASSETFEINPKILKDPSERTDKTDKTDFVSFVSDQLRGSKSFNEADQAPPVIAQASQVEEKMRL